MAEELERIYIIPLKKDGHNQSKAAPTAIKRVKHFLTRHMKVEKDKIWIDDSLNKAIWAKGKFKMPSKIRVKAVKFDDGVVEAYLPELEFKKSRRELLKEEREKKEPILKKEEAAPEKAEGEAAPAEPEYQITPTAEGEVKIKKKKAPKKKESEEKILEEKVTEEKVTQEKEKKEEKKKPKKKKTSTKETEKKEGKKTTLKKVTPKEKTDSKETEKSE